MQNGWNWPDSSREKFYKSSTYLTIYLPVNMIWPYNEYILNKVCFVPSLVNFHFKGIRCDQRTITISQAFPFETFEQILTSLTKRWW